MTTEERTEAAAALVSYALTVARRRCLRCGFPWLADEAESIGLVALWDAALDYDPKLGAKLKTHVAHRVNYAVMDFVRAPWARRTAQLEAENEIHDEEPGDDAEHIADVARGLIRLAEPRYRPLLKAVYVVGLTQQELAKSLGVNASSAAHHLNAALGAIRAIRRIPAPEQPGRLKPDQIARIRQAMVRQGVTPHAVAARAKFGAGLVQEILRGKTHMTTEMVARLASALCVTSDWILNGAESRHHVSPPEPAQAG